jgi:flagellar FliL protein
MADNKEEAEAEEGGGSSKKKLIIIVVGALLLVGISVGVTLMLLGGGEEAAPEEMAEPEPVKSDPVYTELKQFTVNLAPEDPVTYLQVQLQILSYFPEVTADLEKHKPLIRNNLTLLLGQQVSAELRSPEGKQALQDKVLESVQQVIDKYGNGGEVDNVYFTKFVMQ